MHIKSIDVLSRPIERMMTSGPTSLSEAELLAILIHSGTQKSSAIDLAHNLLQHSLKNLTLSHCMSHKGIGKVKSARIMAGLELGRRLRRSRVTKTKLTSPKQVYDRMHDVLSEATQEHFYAIYLDVRKHIVHEELLFKGTLDAVTVHPREIIAKALEHHASGIIVVHNHPSGDATPSNEDILFTQQLRDACSLLGVGLLDHIIMGAHEYYSFKRKKSYKQDTHS